MTILKKTSKKALVSCLQALAHFGGSAKEKHLCDWTGYSSTTVRHALRIIAHCGLIISENGSVKAVDSLPHPLSNDTGCNIISNALSQVESFIELTALLITGHEVHDCVRRAVLVEQSLDDLESAYTILGIAHELGLLEREDDGDYSVVDDIKLPTIVYIGSDFDASNAQVALREVIGSKVYSSLARTERDRLGQAIRSISTNPEKACEDAGKVVENYLRLVARDAHMDVSGCNGLTQVSDALAAKNVAIIRPQHRVIAHEVAMSRNASGHDRDKHTLSSWEKTPAFARANVLLAIRLIASVFAWVKERCQIL